MRLGAIVMQIVVIERAISFMHKCTERLCNWPPAHSERI